MDSSALLDSIRESFGRLVYTHKTHEKAADHLSNRTQRIKMVELILIVTTTTTVIGVLFSDKHFVEILASILSAFSLLVTVYLFRFDPERTILAHRMCARKLWLIREKYIALICDLADGSMNADDARAQRDHLIGEMHCVYETAPDSDPKAYQAAQRALQDKEEMTFSDEEIDKFLPYSARKCNRLQTGTDTKHLTR